MTRDKIKLIANVPLVLEIEDLGTEKSSRFHDGVEYCYCCSVAGTPSIMYLPVDGHLAIKRSGAVVGDELEICKSMFQGRTTFRVRRFSDAQSAPAAPVPAPQGVRMLAPRQQLAARYEVRHSEDVQPYSQPAPAPERVASAAPVATVHPMEEMMTRCLLVGYRVNQNAYLKLRAQGVEIDAPTWEDVRSTGTSFFIQRMKEGGR